MDAAADALARARTASRENDPETALDLTSSARGSLAEAEQRIDAVTKRLALTRRPNASIGSAKHCRGGTPTTGPM
ncbi:Uncharacterised protein [Mycobacteroides abscessus subsp. abscessus]|nr:Uncharacterised protein [Mycobacteroides abscessus subsp. abscessus]